MTRLLAIALLLPTSISYGGGPAATSGKAPSAAPCGPGHEQITILVPTMVMETRKVMVNECRPVEKSRPVTYYRPQYKTTTVKEECVVQERRVTPREIIEKVRVPVVEYVERTYKTREPVWTNVVREVPVCVPTTVIVDEPYVDFERVETRHKGKRTVWKWVEEKEKRLVTRDAGHWEEKVVTVEACGSVASGCGGCRPRPFARLFSIRNRCGYNDGGDCDSCGPVASKPVTTTCRVWVCKPVQEEVEVPVRKCVPVEEDCEYVTISHRAVNKTRKVPRCVYKTTMQKVTQRVCSYKERVHKTMVPVCRYEIKERKRTIQEVSYVPRKVTRDRLVTTCDLVKEVRQEKYISYETYQVEKEVQVCVCKMVPKTVTVCVGSCHSRRPRGFARFRN